jgi:hypothetical protein
VQLRWLRAAQVARRAAFSGSAWWIEANGRRWSTAREAHAELVEALESLEEDGEGDVGVPAAHVRWPYPRSPLAFQRALDAARRRRLAVIRADPRCGFVAVYSSGNKTVRDDLMRRFAPTESA